jgi:hypothetical protein
MLATIVVTLIIGLFLYLYFFGSWPQAPAQRDRLSLLSGKHDI